MPIDLYGHAYLSTVVDNMRNTNSFFKDLFFGAEELHIDDKIEISKKNGARRIAPFVEEDASALLVKGDDADFFLVSPPNIRVKTDLKSRHIMDERMPGEAIFRPANAPVTSALQRRISETLMDHTRLIENAEEYLCAQAIEQGVITWATEEGAYNIDFGRPAANEPTLGTNWDTAATAPLVETFHQMKRIANAGIGLGVDLCILGADAADAFLAACNAQATLDKRFFRAGVVEPVTDFTEKGAIFHGRFMGVEVWEYNRTAALPDGTDVEMMRAKYALFTTRSQMAQHRLHYAGIRDMKALGSGVALSRRFSKSWDEEDPSARWILTTSRPLPVVARPDATISTAVVS